MVFKAVVGAGFVCYAYCAGRGEFIQIDCILECAGFLPVERVECLLHECMAVGLLYPRVEEGAAHYYQVALVYCVALCSVLLEPRRYLARGGVAVLYCAHCGWLVAGVCLRRALTSRAVGAVASAGSGKGDYCDW